MRHWSGLSLHLRQHEAGVDSTYLDNAVWHLITQLLSKSWLPAFFSEITKEVSRETDFMFALTTIRPIDVMKRVHCRVDEKFSHKKAAIK